MGLAHGSILAIEPGAVGEDRQEQVDRRVERHREAHDHLDMHLGSDDPLGVVKDTVEPHVGLHDAGRHREAEAG